MQPYIIYDLDLHNEKIRLRQVRPDPGKGLTEADIKLAKLLLQDD